MAAVRREILSAHDVESAPNPHSICAPAAAPHLLLARGASITAFYILIFTQKSTAAYLSISYSFIPTFTAFITWRTDIKQRHLY